MPQTVKEPCGVLIVNKHAGATSHDIVNKIRRLYGTRRVGHTGTLDPMATGVLVVLVGRAAKASEYLMSKQKSYVATLRLGTVTDTGDTTGTVLSVSDHIPTADELQAVLPRFRGEILQTPPMYSALKVNGRKLVDLARRGETVERKPRPVTVSRLEAIPTESRTDYRLEVTCSGGTYIRALCEDIGSALGCGGTMAGLCRTETCGFFIASAHTVDELTEMDDDSRLACLLPPDSLFRELPSIRLQEFHEKLLRGGCAVLQNKLKVDFPVGTRVRLLNPENVFFALGEVTEAEEGSAVKVVKTFVLEGVSP